MRHHLPTHSPGHPPPHQPTASPPQYTVWPSPRPTGYRRATDGLPTSTGATQRAHEDKEKQDKAKVKNEEKKKKKKRAHLSFGAERRYPSTSTGHNNINRPALFECCDKIQNKHGCSTRPIPGRQLRALSCFRHKQYTAWRVSDAYAFTACKTPPPRPPRRERRPCLPRRDKTLFRLKVRDLYVGRTPREVATTGSLPGLLARTNARAPADGDSKGGGGEGREGREGREGGNAMRRPHRPPSHAGKNPGQKQGDGTKLQRRYWPGSSTAVRVAGGRNRSTTIQIRINNSLTPRDDSTHSLSPVLVPTPSLPSYRRDLSRVLI